MVNDSIRGVRLNCLITAWASVMAASLLWCLRRKVRRHNRMCIVFIYLTSWTQWQCCKSRWLPVSSHFSPSEELANYKAMRVPPACSNPLEFWQEHAATYPVMSATARRELCLSASSAQSERDFSSVGRSLLTCKWRHCRGYWTSALEKRAGLMSC